MRNDVQKKVSSRELRRVLNAQGQGLASFSSAALEDLTRFQGELKVTRELCADLSERLEKVNRDVVVARLETTKLAGGLIRFMSQGWRDRLLWLVLGR